MATVVSGLAQRAWRSVLRWPPEQGATVNLAAATDFAAAGLVALTLQVAARGTTPLLNGGQPFVMWPQKDHLSKSPGEKRGKKTKKIIKNHQKHVIFARKCIFLR